MSFSSDLTKIQLTFKTPTTHKSRSRTGIDLSNIREIPNQKKQRISETVHESKETKDFKNAFTVWDRANLAYLQEPKDEDLKIAAQGLSRTACKLSKKLHCSHHTQGNNYHLKEMKQRQNCRTNPSKNILASPAAN